MSSTRPRFSWLPIILHFVLAYALSWLFQINQAFSAIILQLAEAMSLIIPSITAYYMMASNPNWAASYLLICWLGAPFYFLFCWRLSENILPKWVAAQVSIRFWMVCGTNLIGAISLLTLPSRHMHLSDTTESVRAAAIVVSLIKEHSFVFAIVTLMVVCIFSFISAATIKAVQLRTFGNISDYAERGNK